MHFFISAEHLSFELLYETDDIEKYNMFMIEKI